MQEKQSDNDYKLRIEKLNNLRLAISKSIDIQQKIFKSIGVFFDSKNMGFSISHLIEDIDESRILILNDTFVNAFEINKEKWINRPVSDLISLIHPEDLQSTIDYYMSNAGNDWLILDYFNRYISTTGKILYCKWSGFSYSTGEGFSLVEFISQDEYLKLKDVK